MGIIATSAKERFWKYVFPEPMSGCWLWIGPITSGRQSGLKYGSLTELVAGKSKTRSAHTLSFEIHKGLVPKGLEIDHLCRNTLCVNPEHLESVTHKVNALRGISPSAKNSKKTHCIRGHILEGPHLYITKAGSRACRTCNTLLAREYRKRKA